MPGAAKWTMTTIGTSRGAKCQVSRNRNASMTRLATNSMIAAVRETVATVPPRTITSETHQPRPKRTARYSASGAASAKRAPSAIGCSADPRARMSPRRVSSVTEPASTRKGKYWWTWSNGRPSGPRLDQSQHGEHGGAQDEEFHDGQDLRVRADDADDEVEEDDDAQRQRQPSYDEALVLGHPPRIREVARDEREREEQHRAVEPASAKRDVGLREQRQRPEQEHEGDEDAVRLDVERQVDREHVAPHRDEEDDDQDGRDNPSPVDAGLTHGSVRTVRPTGHVQPAAVRPRLRARPRARPRVLGLVSNDAEWGFRLAARLSLHSMSAAACVVDDEGDPEGQQGPQEEQHDRPRQTDALEHRGFLRFSLTVNSTRSSPVMRLLACSRAR